MSLTAHVRLYQGRYEAGGTDDRYAEDVPSPARLFMAAVAAKAHDAEPTSSVALRWLESQRPPYIIVPAVLDTGRDEAYLVTNTVSPGKSGVHVGRINAHKHRAWVNFSGDEFIFSWPSEPDIEIVTELNELAAQITYVGRIESRARIEFRLEETVTPEGWREYEPTRLDSGEVEVSAPYPGYLDNLSRAYEEGARAWEVTRQISYRLVRPEPASNDASGPFKTLLQYRIDGAPIDGSLSLDLTHSLRAGLMGVTKRIVGADHLPPLIHGHASGSPHLAYVSFPWVCDRHADGRIRGVALAIPDGVPAQDLAILGRALSSDGFTTIPFGRVKGRSRRLRIAPLTAADTPLNLSKRRWGTTACATTWTTATPLMLDRHPHKKDSMAALVANTVEASGYPRPIHVELSPSPIIAGAVRYRRGWQGAIGSRSPRPLLHATMTFPVAVRGPVLVGALRYLGGGICVPTPRDRWATAPSRPRDRKDDHALTV